MVDIKMQMEIQGLIKSKREGEYWDFKREPHSNNAALLHDILCLSNTLHQGDRYLIIGVSDPSEGCKVIGLSKGQTNRKTQANLIDFLRNIPFAGNMRPEVELVSIKLGRKVLDIIRIFDNPFKPYYIVEDYKKNDKCVKAHYIYTRVCDTNTPIDSSADLYHIEKMWRNRFGIDKTPADRLRALLGEPDEWFEDFGELRYAYHKTFPEFRITITKPINKWEPFCNSFLSNDASHGTAYFKYHSTTLLELIYWYCDEMRIMISLPSSKYVRIHNEDQWFYYYDLSTWEAVFLKFLNGNQLNIESRCFYAPFVFFANEGEREDFVQYLEKNEELLNSLEPVVLLHTEEKWNSRVKLEFSYKVKMIYDKYYSLRNNDV